MSWLNCLGDLTCLLVFLMTLPRSRRKSAWLIFKDALAYSSMWRAIFERAPAFSYWFSFTRDVRISSREMVILRIEIVLNNNLCVFFLINFPFLPLIRICIRIRIWISYLLNFLIRGRDLLPQSLSFKLQFMVFLTKPVDLNIGVA